MKKILSIIAAAVLTLSMFLPQLAISQSPEKMSFQAVIRDSSDDLLMNAQVGMQISILQGSANGAVVYTETHSLTTNVNGLVSIEVGGGPGFSSIAWGSGIHFIKTESDPTGGTNYTITATNQLLSVPYALHAGDDGDWTQAAGTLSTDKLVGIGVNNPEATLDIAGGDWDLDAGNPGDLRIGNASNNFRIGIATEGGGAGVTRVYSNSNALILGANNAPSLILELDGSITAPSVSDSLIDNAGNKALITKEYAVTNFSSTGLEALDEGNGIGWRIIGRESAYYDTIGSSAVDLSTSITDIFIRGASGDISTAMGFATYASGSTSTAMGSNTAASGSSSTAMGSNTAASGNSSTAMGRHTTAPSYAETAIGMYTTAYTPISLASWEPSDRLFVVGNGLNNSNRSNALTILKNGSTTINSSANGLIINAAHSGLQIDNAGFSGVSVLSADNNGGFFRGVIAGVHAESSVDANADLILGGTSGTAAGDNGIISSDPNYAGSDIILRSNDAVAVIIDFDNDENGEFEIFNGAGAEVFEVNESGDVRVNGSLIHASDKRLKKDIEDLPYGLKEILQLQPKAYNWKDRTQEHKSLGLIAQDVQPLIKEIVTAKDDAKKTLGISYTALIPVLIKAIQEQQETIDELKQETTAQAEALNSNTTLMKELQSIIDQQSQK